MATKQVTEISCDRCPHAITTDDVQPIGLDYGFASFHTITPDGEALEFMLCENCLSNLLTFIKGLTVKRLPDRKKGEQ